MVKSPFAVLVSEHRLVLGYAFGLCCLLCWLAFNLWVLRDYFFPCGNCGIFIHFLNFGWYPPIYTERGLRKTKLETMKHNYLVRARMSDAFQLTASVAAGHFAKKFMAQSKRQRSAEENGRPGDAQQQNNSIAVPTTDAWQIC
ncbi:hypothetical protein GPALN_005610 [Globodera pallida]|nr:hypothetical protein GPALN_005610 [Globodera pallida]